jgi:protein O-mannosyl-transferase
MSRHFGFPSRATTIDMGSKKHRQKLQRSPQPPHPHKPPPQTLLWLLRPRPKLWLSLLLVGLTLAVYLQVCRFEIVDFDDSDYVGDNLYVNHGLTRDGVAWAFSGFHFANWIPLTWLSLMLDATLFGRWPPGNHITNLILHTANVLLVFATFVKATGNAPRSAFVAALFAIHPLHVESVAWISERKDVLSMLFGVLALYSYVSYALGRRWSLLVLAWLLFALSLMAKQTFVTLPFLFLLLDYWPLGRLADDTLRKSAEPTGGDSTRIRWDPRRIARIVLEKIPFLALSAAFCVVAVKAQASGSAIPTWIPLTTRVLNAICVYGLYLWKAFLPLRLAPFYPLPAQLDVVGLGFSLAALAAITGFALVSLRKRPYVLVGWLWYLGALVPVIGFVQIGRQQMADRYTYLPLLGIYLAVAWLVPSLIPEPATRRRLLPIAAVIAISGYAVIGFVQVSYWHDGVTLFQRALAVTADNATTQGCLGSALFRKDRFREARPHLERAVQLEPNNAIAHFSLGRAWEVLGRPQEAFAEYQAALALNEAYPNAHNDVGLALVNQGKFADAQRHFERAIEIDPTFASGYGNLGMLYGRMGQSEKAIALCEKALQLDPGLLNCHQTIATVLAGEGRYDEAIARLRELLRVNPGNEDARQELDRITAIKEGRFRAGSK